MNAVHSIRLVDIFALFIWPIITNSNIVRALHWIFAHSSKVQINNFSIDAYALYYRFFFSLLILLCCLFQFLAPEQSNFDLTYIQKRRTPVTDYDEMFIYFFPKHWLCVHILLQNRTKKIRVKFNKYDSVRLRLQWTLNTRISRRHDASTIFTNISIYLFCTYVSCPKLRSTFKIYISNTTWGDERQVIVHRCANRVF